MYLCLQGSLMFRNKSRKRQLLREWDTLSVRRRRLDTSCQACVAKPAFTCSPSSRANTLCAHLHGQAAELMMLSYWDLHTGSRIRADFLPAEPTAALATAPKPTYCCSRSRAETNQTRPPHIVVCTLLMI